MLLDTSRYFALMRPPVKDGSTQAIRGNGGATEAENVCEGADERADDVDEDEDGRGDGEGVGMDERQSMRLPTTAMPPAPAPTTIAENCSLILTPCEKCAWERCAWERCAWERRC